MKKIGILTLYFANNVGAFMQAFALQEVLKSMGHEVEFIKLKEFESREHDLNAKYCAQTRKEYLNIAEKIYDSETSDYDVIVVGSDEMWNVKNPSFEHLPEYVGHELKAKKIISYAPSANGTTIDLFEQTYKDTMAFDNFDVISVRDTNTKRLIKEITGEDVELVLDPTLLLESYDEYIKYKNDANNYVLVYGYKFSNEEKEKIIRFAEFNNLKIYSLGFDKDWCEALHGDVFELLGYIKNANYVVINTFHGLLFSMILEKEFAVFGDENQKVVDLINRFGLESRTADSEKELNHIFDTKVDYERINEIKLSRRCESLKFLTEAI